MASPKYKIFIDGRAGTTGLRIEEYLSGRGDIEIMNIDESRRKDTQSRASLIEESDVSFLCLPDDGAREIASVVSPGARIIDASTAHRTSDEWVYGLPELAQDQRARIASANRVAMAGCHAAGFILLTRPLIDQGIVPTDYPFAVHSITGYSGGGKQMIAQYEAGRGGIGGVAEDSSSCDRGTRADCVPKKGGASGSAIVSTEFSQPTDLLGAPRQYALGQVHKHLPEMVKMSGADDPPLFSPHVANYYAGLEMVVPLHRRLLNGARMADVRRALESRYEGEKFVRVMPSGYDPEEGFLSAGAMAGRNDMEIFVYGNEERILLTARYDNLGKGASGSGVQCMNLMLELDEYSGLA